MYKAELADLEPRAEWPYFPDVTLDRYAEALRNENPHANSLERTLQILNQVNTLTWPPGSMISDRFSKYNFFHTMIKNFHDPKFISDIRKRVLYVGMRTEREKTPEDMELFGKWFDDIVSGFDKFFAEHPLPWSKDKIQRYIDKFHPTVNRSLIHIIGDGTTTEAGESYNGNDILHLGCVPHDDLGTPILAQDLCKLFDIESELKAAYWPSKKKFKKDLDGELHARRHVYLIVNHPEIGRRRYDPVLQLRHFYGDYPEEVAAIYREQFTNTPDSKTVLHLRRREKDGSPSEYVDAETVRISV